MYLRPTAPISANVLLPANPADAMALAQALIEKPLMANHSYGLWGYSGRTPAGSQLTVQSTGIGGPSAAAVLFELVEHGARRAVRVGYGHPLKALADHRPVVVRAALRGDGASRALGEADAALPDPALTGALKAALGERALEATVLSRDLHGPPGPLAAHPRAGEALFADLESAALLAAGERAGVAVAGALVVANGDAEAATQRLLALGSAAVAALCGTPATA